MKILLALGFMAALVLAFVLGAGLERLGVLDASGTTYLKTTEPLLLTSEGESRSFHLLPPETAMYRDYSFPEGHTRYIVYVNFKGAFAAELIESDKRKLIDPIWAHTVEKEAVTPK